MVMFTAYIDESGTHKNSQAIAVAGYVSTVDQWQRFEDEWKDILSVGDLSFFHMADYEARQGPYKDWDNSKRRRILERLILTIRRRTYIAISAAVGMADYLAVFGGQAVLSPYTFCAIDCINRVRKWADQYGHHEPIAYVFEAGAGHNRDLILLRNVISRDELHRQRSRFDSFSIMNKRGIGALQAADIHAYEAYKAMIGWIIPRDAAARPRRSVVALLEGRPEYAIYHSRESLQAAALSFPKPES